MLVGVAQALRDAQVEDAHVTFLLSEKSTSAESLKRDLTAAGHGQCQVCLHDPDNEKETAFLGYLLLLISSSIQQLNTLN